VWKVNDRKGTPRPKKYTVGVEWFDGSDMSQYYAHVKALDPAGAWTAAINETLKVIYGDEDDPDFPPGLDDVKCLFIFRGHLTDESEEL
jgi:hypothetical protein